MKPRFDILIALQQCAPIHSTDRFIVAISGGVDSVVLATLCKEASLHIELAHCNFQLRGAESDRDEALVSALAANWKVPLHVNKVDLAALATAQKSSIQETARAYRYQWFDQLASRAAGESSFESAGSNSPTWILTAHHADDNAETVAMHFFRGTGLAGLTGIPPRQGKILRPLLSLWRKDILQWGAERQVRFAEDSSNASEKYTRNYFRHSILPAVEKVFPSVKENLVASIERFTDIESLYRLGVDRLRKSLLVKKGKEFKIAVRALQPYQGRALFFELFSPYGFSVGQLTEIQKLLQAGSGAQLVAASGTYRLIRDRNSLLLGPIEATASGVHTIETSPSNISFCRGRLAFTNFLYQEQKIPTANTVAWLDAKQIGFPMLLRPWRAGDYFYPLGMRKKKKLSRFFIDEKRSLSEKENVWVLESKGKVVWVIGMRIDDRFKISPKTRKVLSIQFTAVD